MSGRKEGEGKPGSAKREEMEMGGFEAKEEEEGRVASDERDSEERFGSEQRGRAGETWNKEKREKRRDICGGVCVRHVQVGEPKTV